MPHTLALVGIAMGMPLCWFNFVWTSA